MKTKISALGALIFNAEKKKRFFFLIVAVGVIFWCFFFYQKKQNDDFTQEQQIADVEDKIPPACEKGDWIAFPDYPQKGDFPQYIGNQKIKFIADKKFTNEDGSIVFATDENYSLTFYIDREVRIEGVETENNNGVKKVYVNKIKCIGEEADVNLQAQRQKLMKYIADNINTIAPEKSKDSKWRVQTFYFYNKTDIYVEYESPESFTGDSLYDGRLWLIRASKMDRDIPVIETLAYIQEDAEDPEKNVVKIGQDLYKDADNMTVYEFDDELNRWSLQ